MNVTRGSQQRINTISRNNRSIDDSTVSTTFGPESGYHGRLINSRYRQIIDRNERRFESNPVDPWPIVSTLTRSLHAVIFETLPGSIVTDRLEFRSNEIFLDCTVIFFYFYFWSGLFVHG